MDIRINIKNIFVAYFLIIKKNYIPKYEIPYIDIRKYALLRSYMLDRVTEKY